jgi:hypothetical protein
MKITTYYKAILILAVFCFTFALQGCGSGDKSRAAEDMTFIGSATQFVKVQNGFPLGTHAIEQSLIWNAATQKIDVFFDATNHSDDLYVEYNPVTGEFTDNQWMDIHVRFPYTVYDEDRTEWITFGQQGVGDQFDNQMRAWKSLNKLNWTALNSYAPIFDHSVSENWRYIWNPSAVKVGGWYYMLSDCDSIGNNGDKTGLCSSQCRINADDTVTCIQQAAQAIPHGGCNWIGYVAGKGFIAIIAEGSTGTWEILAATSPDGITWTVSNNFRIKQAGVHLCDPHLVETPYGLYLTFSFDQWDSILYKANMTLAELFDYL